MIVVDTSAVVDALVAGPGSRALRDRIAGEDLHAPHLLDREVVSALRRMTLGGRLSALRVEGLLTALEDLTIERWPGLDVLWRRAFALRSNVTAYDAAYDAAYVALAEVLGCPLVTRDGPAVTLQRPPRPHRAVVTAVPVAAEEQLVLLDVDGRLLVAGEPVPGAVHVVPRLRADGHTVRFLTNTDSQAAGALLARLRHQRFDVRDGEPFTPVVAARQVLLAHPSARAPLLVTDAVAVELAVSCERVDPAASHEATHVVVGDARETPTYPLLDAASRQAA